MKEQCFDTGTIQAFLDGELSSEMLETVARHVALCDECALLLQEAEEESAFAFDILGDEFNTLVPTERIRANVYQAIAQIDKPKVSFWQKVLNFKLLSNPSIVAFASLMIVFGVFVTVLSFRNTDDQKYNIAAKGVEKVNLDVQTPVRSAPSVAPDLVAHKQDDAPRIEKTVYKPEPRIENFNNQRAIVKDRKPTIPSGKIPAIEGEDTYLKTIATLEASVNAKKDNILRASSRVSYERDMAVIDDSINKMKAEVRKNPKNDAAKQILRNSYQNKIELLNSVTERSELMARLD